MMISITKKLPFVFSLFFFFSSLSAQENTVWKIGEADNSGKGMALYPEEYHRFIEKDFGFEDRFFALGFHEAEEDWPFILPGPQNEWGGTGPMAGIRSHVLNLEFALPEASVGTSFNFLIDLLDNDTIPNSTLKVKINEKTWKFNLDKGKGLAVKTGEGKNSEEKLIRIEIGQDVMRTGSNTISLTLLEGGWIAFDQLKLSSDKPVSLKPPSQAIVKMVEAADYEREGAEGNYQPLLIETLHLSGEPVLKVKLDKKEIFSKIITGGTYLLEAPMPAVDSPQKSQYIIEMNGKVLAEGSIQRNPQPTATPADAVNTLMGTGHSRWMLAPGPWLPFSMVKISPDNQDGGWQAGYDPTIESIGTFSHIHEWTMAGLGTFPTTGKLQTQTGNQRDPESGYRSRIDKDTEEAPVKYYKVHLTDTDITAAITATTRASFQKYTFHSSDEGRVMIDLTVPAEYGYQVLEAEITKTSDKRIEGFSRQLSRDVWSGGVDQEYILHFVMEFDQPISTYGSWIDEQVTKSANLKTEQAEKAGMYVEFDTRNNNTVQLRIGISYVSIENAALNLQEEITKPFDWDFDAIAAANRAVWNDLLGRIKIKTDDQREYTRFYTNMYRSLASRNIFSDVDGRWRNADEEILQFQDADEVALSGDAFWNTFWNLNQFWNLVTPEWSLKWVKSQLAVYESNGWLAKGPAGMEYIPVMVGEHEIPLIVGAYQMGIRDFDEELAFEAVHKMQTTPGTQVGGGFAGNRDLESYLQFKYVPYDKGRFSNTLEYSFDDWTVGQFAKALGEEAAYKEFNKRGSWWKNVIDPVSGYAHMKDAEGQLVADFDPFKSGANHHYVEGNAWQLTFYVPQDVPALAARIGEKKFLDRLEWGFEESNKWRYNGPNDQYWDYPVVQGNQQSMHFAFLFNWIKKPWLTQKWSRSIMERYYGYGLGNAYLGDEDQGQMSAWFVMSALGLFQTDGGTAVRPIYELGSPLFEEVELDLGERFGRGKTITIKAHNASRKNKYIQKATLNGRPLDNFWFYADELLRGGELILEMGAEPNKAWGTDELPER